MLQHFYRYLLLNRQASVPGVGSFSIETFPASFEVNSINPPQHLISFKAGSALTDKQFYQFLASETGMSEVDAVRKFQDFAYQLRKDLQSNPQLHVTGLGILKRSATGEIAFEPQNSIQQFFSPVRLTEVQKQDDITVEDDAGSSHGIEVEEEVEPIKKDYWWIWALLLAVTALAVIGYFYMQGDIM